ncbi:MAG: DUF2934 domain-containing protein [Acidobacteria bacterium]|nr:DUF2934 domain-containing protein [Acidobacteriota bacterium]
MATRKTTRTPSPSADTPSPAPRARRASAPRKKAPAAEAPAGRRAVAPTEATEATEEEIRVRAYFLSLERRHPAADPRADWLRAEQELAAARGVTSGLAAGQS